MHASLIVLGGMIKDVGKGQKDVGENSGGFFVAKLIITFRTD